MRNTLIASVPEITSKVAGFRFLLGDFFRHT